MVCKPGNIEIQILVIQHRDDVFVKQTLQNREVYNEAGQLALAYNVFRCWVSEFQAVPELDANANAIAIQTLKLENEGWERDYEVTEPTEPSFSEPA